MAEIKLRSNQIPCYEKLLGLDKALIAAKPRFGKTFTSIKLMIDSGVKILIVISGKNVRGEWADALAGNFDHVITSNTSLNNYDLANLNQKESYAFFVSTQKAGRNIFQLRDSKDDFVAESNVALIDAYNNYEGLKGLIIDEAHFAEQTERSQLVIENYHYDKLLYLSGTPYTNSITKRFDEAHTFKYSILDEQRDYKEGKLDYVPIKMHMYIVDTVVPLEEDGAEDWNKTIISAEILNKFLSKITNTITKLNSKNNLLVCDTIKQGNIIKAALNNLEGIKVKSALGGSNRLTSEQAENFFIENTDTYNFIITCDRLCTGSTIRPLQSVIFCCSTRSAIRFIQTSMRACSPFESKTIGNVVCCNKFASYQVYCTMAALERKDKKTTNINQSDFDAMAEAFPITLINDELDFRAVSYIDATNFEDMYAHGKTKFFTDIESLEDLHGFNLLIGSLKKALAGVDKKDKDAILNAAKKGGRDEAKKEAKTRGIDLVDDEPDIEQTRKLMQEHFTGIISQACCLCSVTVNEDKTIEVDFDGFETDVIDNGWTNIEDFKSIVDEHPEYVRCIYNYYKTQFEEGEGAING